MIDIKQLLPYYPKPIAENASFHKHILKEYVELLALEHLSQTHYAPKLVFIGGTCLRLSTVSTDSPKIWISIARTFRMMSSYR